MSCPELGAKALHAARSLAQPDRQAAYLDLAIHLFAMRLDQVVVLPGLRILGDFLERLDRARDDAPRRPAIHPILRLPLLHDPVENRHQLRVVRRSLLRGREPRVIGELLMLEALAEPRPVLVGVLLAEEHPLVLRLIAIPQGVAGLLPGLLRRVEIIARSQEGLKRGRAHEELGSVEGSIDGLSHPRSPALVERHHDAEGRHDAPIGVARAHPQIDGRLTGLSLPGHDARQGLHVDVVGRPVDLDRMTVAGVGGVDDPGVDRLQLLVVEVQTLEDAHGKVGQEDIRLLHQLVEEFLPLFLLQIDRQALLVAVDHQEVLVPVTDGQRLDAADAACTITGDRALDVDDLCAEVCQVLRADGSLQPLGQVENANPFPTPFAMLNSRPSDAPLRERLDLGIRVPQPLLQDLGGVLPNTGRHAAKPRRALAHVDGKAQALDRTVARVIQVQDVPIDRRDWIGCRIVVLFDHVCRKLLLIELPLPMRARLPGEDLLQYLHHLEPMLPAALLVAVEARIVDVEAHDLGESRPVFVGVGHGERHPAAIGAGIHRATHRIARVEPRDRLEEAILPHRKIGLHVQALRVHVPAEERRIHHLALAGLVAMVERHHDAQGEHHRRLHLADAGVDRRLTRLNQRRHHPGASRRQLVVRREIAIRPFGPEARAARIDDVRLELAEALVIPALLVQRSRTEGRSGRRRAR